MFNTPGDVFLGERIRERDFTAVGLYFFITGNSNVISESQLVSACRGLNTDANGFLQGPGGSYHFVF